MKAPQSIVYYLLIMIWVAGAGIRPALNFDAIPYVALATEGQHASPQALHDATYSALKEEVPASLALEFAGQNTTFAPEYRQTLAKEPEALQENLPLYRGRVLYILLIKTLIAIGIAPFAATVWAAALPNALTLGLVGLWSRNEPDPRFRWGAPLLALGCGLWTLGTISSPDALALLGMVSLYLTARQRPGLSALVAPALVLLRTDLALFSLAALLTGVWSKQLSKSTALLGAALTVLTYGALQAFTGHPGWLTLVSFTFVEFVPYPLSSPPPHITVVQWVRAAASTLLTLPRSAEFWVSVLLMGSVLWTLGRPVRAQLRQPDFRLALLLGTWLWLGARFLLFPSLQLRFFVPASVLTSLLGLSWLLSASATTPSERAD